MPVDVSTLENGNFHLNKCPWRRCGELIFPAWSFPLKAEVSFSSCRLRSSEMHLEEWNLCLVSAVTAYSAHIQRDCRGTRDRAEGQQASVNESTSAIEGELLWGVTVWILNEPHGSTSTESVSLSRPWWWEWKMDMQRKNIQFNWEKNKNNSLKSKLLNNVLKAIQMVLVLLSAHAGWITWIFPTFHVS